jgi:hypothetical protein
MCTMAKTELQEVHNRILGRNLETKSLNWWCNCISNNVKTLQDFEQSLLESDEYVAKISALYKTVWREHMMSQDVNHDAEDNFVENFFGKYVTIDDIFHHIVQQVEYTAKHRDMIQSEYRINYNEFPTEEVIQFYLDKFKSDMSYDIHNLSRDVVASAHTAPVNVNVNDNAIEAPTMFEPSIELLQPQPSIIIRYVTPTMNTDAIVAFESAFGRPMYVQEYFKYIINANTDPDFHALHLEHEYNYNRLNEIFTSYTGQPIEEYPEYIMTYFNDVENAGFFENIIEDIISSEGYRFRMSKHIATLYKQLYDEDLEASDVEWIFSIVKRQKLCISDDRINNTLATFKTETDEITSHIFKVFLTVLGRQPDMFEIEQYIEEYRRQVNDDVKPVTYQMVDSVLENNLIKSLEFHDVIKKKIKETYNGKEIRASVLFEILNKVLAVIGGTEAENIAFANIDKIIQDCTGKPAN